VPSRRREHVTVVRFSVQAQPTQGGKAWTELARRVEDLGFDALYVADHLGMTADPFAALAAAAAVTSSLRLGTYVLNAGIRESLFIASGAATVDALSGGRMILGIGAGHTPAEWTMLGRPYPTAQERVACLRTVVGELRAHLPDDQQIPLLIGGNGRRVLQLAASEADIVGLAGLGRTLEDGYRHEALWSPAAIDEQVAIVRETGRVVVLDALVQHFQISHERAEVAEVLASRVQGLTPAEALAAPYALFGTVEQLVEELARHRDRWGFTSYVVRADAIDDAAQVLRYVP
jgi:probable F420-dependent oxidoreductase